jgi:fermentation-respiration switch protein FrsA (DUF1100 family)
VRFLGGAIALAAGLAVLKAAVFLLEPKLAFFPARALDLTPRAAGLPYEDLRAVTADGLTLRGWFVPAPASTGGRPLTLLVFHGNAENIGHGLDLAERAHRAGYAVALGEYRGYAGNPGNPSERGLYLDGEAIFQAVAARSDVDPARVVFWGRSIGAAVAGRLASSGRGAGLVLESPFLSVGHLLRDDGAWLLYGLSLLGSYRFELEPALSSLEMPLLVIHGTRDEIAPFAHGRRLHDLARGPRTLVALEGGGHNDLWALHGDALWAGAERFLRTLDGDGDQSG